MRFLSDKCTSRLVIRMYSPENRKIEIAAKEKRAAEVEIQIMNMALCDRNTDSRLFRVRMCLDCEIGMRKTLRIKHKVPKFRSYLCTFVCVYFVTSNCIKSPWCRCCIYFYNAYRVGREAWGPDPEEQILLSVLYYKYV